MSEYVIEEGACFNVTCFTHMKVTANTAADPAAPTLANTFVILERERE